MNPRISELLDRIGQMEEEVEQELNLLEKINRAYCSYANGFAAYFREVAGRVSGSSRSRRFIAAWRQRPGTGPGKAGRSDP